MSMTHKQGTPYTEPKKKWGVGRTKQSAEAETNINNIIARFKKTGQLTHISSALGAYRDLSGLPDMHAAMNIVANAQSMFEELPAAIRKRMGHDMGNFLPFIDDPKNLEECIDMGLLPESLRPKEEKPKPESEAKSVPTEPTGEADGSVQGGE